MGRLVLVFVDVRGVEYPKRYLDNIVTHYGYNNVFVIGYKGPGTYRAIDVPNPTLLRQGCKLITANPIDRIAYKGDAEDLRNYG